jgi:hypothetical protein
MTSDEANRIRLLRISGGARARHHGPSLGEKTFELVKPPEIVSLPALSVLLNPNLVLGQILKSANEFSRATSALAHLLPPSQRSADPAPDHLLPESPSK